MYVMERFCAMARGIETSQHEYNISHFDSSWTPGVFYTNFYYQARRLRLEKLLHLKLSRSFNGFVKVLLDPGGGFATENAARRFQK